MARKYQRIMGGLPLDALNMVINWAINSVNQVGAPGVWGFGCGK
jgi:hypothetical protein